MQVKRLQGFSFNLLSILKFPIYLIYLFSCFLIVPSVWEKIITTVNFFFYHFHCLKVRNC